MAAAEWFETYNNRLTDEDRAALHELIKTRRLQILAARSEDARVRLVEVYVREVNDLLKRT